MFNCRRHRLCLIRSFAYSLACNTILNYHENFSIVNPIDKPIYERYNFSEPDRIQDALAKPLWAGTEKREESSSSS